MISDKERENCDKLFRLMKENPGLPIIPFVNGEIVGDDSGRQEGSWGSARVDEYLVPPSDNAPIIFKSDDDVFDTLERCLSIEDYEALPEREEDCRKAYDALPWTKAIIVYIDMPES